MSKSYEEKAVSAWQRLMLQWDAAHISYKAAQDAFTTLGDLESHKEECEEAERRALDEMRAVKQQINRLIEESRSRRKPEAGSLIFGLIEQEASRSKTSSLPKAKPRR